MVDFLPEPEVPLTPKAALSLKVQIEVANSLLTSKVLLTWLNSIIGCSLQKRDPYNQQRVDHFTASAHRNEAQQTKSMALLTAPETPAR